MAKKSWPSWRYGPGGESRIFQEDDIVPAGWEDHPSKVKDPKEPKKVKETRGVKKVKKLGVDENLNGYETIEEILAAYADGKLTLDQIEAAEATRAEPRQGIVKFLETERARETARAEALRVLEEAGVEVSEDVTDEELSEALDALEG